MVPQSWEGDLVECRTDWIPETPTTNFSDHACVYAEFRMQNPQVTKYKGPSSHHTSHKEFQSYREEAQFQVLADVQIPTVPPQRLAETIAGHALPLLAVRAPRYSRGPPPSRTPQHAGLEVQLREARGRKDRALARDLRRRIRPLAREHRRRK
eukprot:370327-Pyramimonas_sp.AAC.1